MPNPRRPKNKSKVDIEHINEKIAAVQAEIDALQEEIAEKEAILRGVKKERFKEDKEEYEKRRLEREAEIAEQKQRAVEEAKAIQEKRIAEKKNKVLDITAYRKDPDPQVP